MSYAWSGYYSRTYFSFAVLASFLTFIFVSGVLHEVRKHVQPNFPDFGHYAGGFLQEIPDNLFPIDDAGKRVVAIGDIHGMNRSLTDLLGELSYDSRRDTLIHLGDLETTAIINDSLDVLLFMTSNKILGVRGNNDQKVIEWRAWMDWILSRRGGREWLAAMDQQWPNLDGDHQQAELDNWIKESKYADWEKMVPNGWRPLGKHYRVARAISRLHFDYLRSLPLVLHSSAGHLFFVHAGLLPFNPKLQASDPKQPLSHWPATMDDQRDVAKLRNLQELAILAEIPQNKDPWIVTNIRGVTNHGDASASNKKGTPWSQLWNDTMSKCSHINETYQLNLSYPCYPFTTVYGHAASRGLDIKRWSIGLDTGCKYGRRLSALLIDQSSISPSMYRSLDDAHPQARDSQDINFGDDGRASIVSVKCT